MKLRVRLFGPYAEAAGRGDFEVELGGEASPASLWDELLARWPSLAGVDRHRIVAVNLDYADPAHSLVEGDEVAFFPPVSGG